LVWSYTRNSPILRWESAIVLFRLEKHMRVD